MRRRKAISNWTWGTVRWTTWLYLHFFAVEFQCHVHRFRIGALVDNIIEWDPLLILFLTFSRHVASKGLMTNTLIVPNSMFSKPQYNIRSSTVDSRIQVSPRPSVTVSLCQCHGVLAISGRSFLLSPHCIFNEGSTLMRATELQPECVCVSCPFSVDVLFSLRSTRSPYGLKFTSLPHSHATVPNACPDDCVEYCYHK